MFGAIKVKETSKGKKVENLGRPSKSRKQKTTDKYDGTSKMGPVRLDKKEINVQIYFILLVVSAITTLYLITFSNRLVTNIQTAQGNIIRFQVEITSEKYRESYADGKASPEYCDDISTYPGISNSTIFLINSNGTRLGESKLSNATSFNYSKCSFTPVLDLKNDFPGGEVKVYVQFPFAQSETYVVDLGTEPPYLIDLDFNLN